MRRIQIVTAALAVVAVLGCTAIASYTPAANAATASRTCRGSITQQAPGAVLTADRLRARRVSCFVARGLVREFLRAQARDIGCAGAAADPNFACVIRGEYECNKSERRAYCMNQGYGVTFRERDRSTG